LTSSCHLHQTYSKPITNNPQPSIKQPNQVVSQTPAPVIGAVTRYDSLAEIQGVTFESPVVVLAERLGGNEDIPAGVVAGESWVE